MAKNKLEDRTHRAVLEIKKKVLGIYDMLEDIGLKLAHVIEYKLDFMPDFKYFSRDKYDLD